MFGRTARSSASPLTSVQGAALEQRPRSSARGAALREREGYRYWVLQEGGNIIATAAVIGQGPNRWLHLLAVDPTMRAQGVGRRMITGVMSSEYASGGRVLTLEVLADNKVACSLYEKMQMHRRWSTRVLTGPVSAPD